MENFTNNPVENKILDRAFQFLSTKIVDVKNQIFNRSPKDRRYNLSEYKIKDLLPDMVQDRKEDILSAWKGERGMMQISDPKQYIYNCFVEYVEIQSNLT